MTDLPLRKVPGRRGGNQHPMSVKQFILDHLARVGEDNPTGAHRAYLAALDRLAIDRGRKFFYKHSTYPSFLHEMKKLRFAGQIELSGRVEESDNPRFVAWRVKPKRYYYRLVK